MTMADGTFAIQDIAPYKAHAAARGSQLFSGPSPAQGAGSGDQGTLQSLLEGVSFSPEASRMMQNGNEVQEKEKSEKVKEIEKKKEDALAQIDTKVMALLSTLKTRQDYKTKYQPVLIEDFQKAKEDSSRMKTSDVSKIGRPQDRQKENGFTDPSFLVLNIMAKDSRLPKEVQSGFGEIAREYAQVLKVAQDEMNALDGKAKNNALASGLLGMLPAAPALQG
jgi:hypothetical protein